MDAKIILKRDNADVKKPLHLKSNVFLLYAPRKIKTEPMDFQRINSGILVFIPKNANGFVTSKFREDKINEICTREQRLWVEVILSFTYRKTKGPCSRVFCSRTRTFTISAMKRQGKLKRRPGKKARKSYRGRKTRQIGGFLNAMTSPMQVETLLTKEQSFHLE